MNEGDFLTLIFGLTSGILTLVGLVAIFISMNTQHNIQKGRELFWSIMYFPLEVQELNRNIVADKMCQYYWLYRDIIENDNVFTKLIIRLSQFAMGLVCIFWLEYVVFFFNIVYGVTILAAIVIICFYIWAFGKLNNINRIGSLPLYKELLDGNTKREFNIPLASLVAYGSTITILKGLDGKYISKLGTNLQFFNLEVNAIVYIEDQNTNQLKLLAKSDIYIDGQGKESSVGIPDFWYDLIEFKMENRMKESIEQLTFQLIFKGDSGASIAHYILEKDELTNLKDGEIFSLIFEDVVTNYNVAKNGTIHLWGIK